MLLNKLDNNSLIEGKISELYYNFYTIKQDKLKAEAGCPALRSGFYVLS